jgi:hypothetical protein
MLLVLLVRLVLQGRMPAPRRLLPHLLPVLRAVLPAAARASIPARGSSSRSTAARQIATTRRKGCAPGFPPNSREASLPLQVGNAERSWAARKKEEQQEEEEKEEEEDRRPLATAAANRGSP